ncbi:hypothetical protein [Actinoplanes sp. DH11]|uniref:deazapurine DNA modification protein DpdA family protein n=1 Tax=Actinoplanes sp. DH11 TaxID=2857011 RepID=UPI001E59635D|nr:hypothetical protein [Actinoplanes sp. DH11]
MTVSTLSVAPAATAAGAVPCAEPTLFYLGTHQPHWLAALGVPLFVSDRRLRRYRRLPVAAAPWALDSGGFTELSQYGTWDTGPAPAVYANRVRRYRDEIGHLAWAAPQDWMCEPAILAKTGLTVAEHQDRTITNYERLRDLAPDLPFVPVVQGWTPGDYLRCVDRYQRAGIDLTRMPLVGVGSVCRRQSTVQVGDILTALHQAGLTRLHGFGFKTLGLARHGHLLASADSMAWSAQARREPALPGCHGHRNCANCARYALAWRTRLITKVAAASRQPALFDIGPAWWSA